MKTIAILIVVLAGINSCAPKAYPANTPNPLDEPGSREATAAELHRANVRAITRNYQ